MRQSLASVHTKMRFSPGLSWSMAASASAEVTRSLMAWKATWCPNYRQSMFIGVASLGFATILVVVIRGLQI